MARINGNEWAVSARGFASQYATKLLVLIDGRTVYSPMFAGVYWNAQDVPLQDLERIEVIRGPGATLWGANAVNGVINIITRNAKDAQGALIAAFLGTESRPSTSLHYGGQLAPDFFYRAYAKYDEREGFVDEPGAADSPDNWRTLRGGLRFDWEPSSTNRVTVQGDYYDARVGEHFERVLLSEPFVEPDEQIHGNHGGNILGRWHHRYSSSSALTLQGYFDRFHQWDGDVLENRDTFDIELQHEFALGARQEIVWGAGFRHTSDELPPSFYLTFDPAEQNDSLYSAFLQDEITLVPNRLTLTLGSKFEHNEYTGSELLPNGRLRLLPNERQTLWAAISRAVRTPARYDLHHRLNTSAFPIPNGPRSS